MRYTPQKRLSTRAVPHMGIFTLAVRRALLVAFLGLFRRLPVWVMPQWRR